ncbi:MAG TPA: hypothetical protein PLX67_01035 [bacterium]|jgi:hypothetical protein|nr:hypothetical protein [bacterium]HNZ51419.1 hypothetical protein [bacterium]HOF79400.1 hypothetical protein [bacterium]HOH85576.1 hypothetical protein [bacterium]HOQ91477.1 hypothetical protein [bacterium]
MHCQLTLARLNQDQAILTDKSGRNFIFPTDQLPAGSQPGTILTCLLMNPSQPDSADQQLAKDILNELLKID